MGTVGKSLTSSHTWPSRDIWGYSLKPFTLIDTTVDHFCLGGLSRFTVAVRWLREELVCVLAFERTQILESEFRPWAGCVLLGANFEVGQL